jgi:hypothetical protein
LQSPYVQAVDRAGSLILRWGRPGTGDSSCSIIILHHRFRHSGNTAVFGSRKKDKNSSEKFKAQKAIRIQMTVFGIIVQFTIPDITLPGSPIKIYF